MGNTIRVLIIDDSESDAMVVMLELKRAGYDALHMRVETEGAMKAALREGQWDLIISDYVMPSFSGTAAMDALRQTGFDIPFIMVSGIIGEETAVAAMRAGARDFISKDKLGRLGPAVDRELKEALVRRERMQAGESLLRSEGLFKALFNHAQDGIVLATRDERGGLVIADANQAACAMHGYGVRQLKGAQLEDIFVPGETNRLKGALDGIEDGESILVEAMHRRVGAPEGFPAETKAGWLAIAGERYLLLMIRDTAGRKADELRIRTQLERLTALRTIDMAITSSHDLGVALEVFFEQVVLLAEADAVDILLLEADGTELVYRGGRGFHSEMARAARIRPGRGAAGEAVIERRTVLIREPSGLPGEHERSRFLEAEGIRSYACVPMISKGRVLGVLEVFKREPLRGGTDWVEFIESLASQATILVEGALVFEGLRRDITGLTLAYDETLDAICKRLDAAHNWLPLADLAYRCALDMGLAGGASVSVRRAALLMFMAGEGRAALRPFEKLYALPFTREIWEALDSCRERYAGEGGTPGSRSGARIPIGARILAAIEFYRRLRYTEGQDAGTAMDALRGEAGRMLDPQAVDALTGALGRAQSGEQGE